jgi:hypothetical protein
MLNPLIDRETTNNELNKDEYKKNDKINICDDCTWCIFCDFDCLFMCCLE